MNRLEEIKAKVKKQEYSNEDLSAIDRMKLHGEKLIEIAEALEPLQNDDQRLRVIKAVAILLDIPLDSKN